MILIFTRSSWCRWIWHVKCLIENFFWGSCLFTLTIRAVERNKKTLWALFFSWKNRFLMWELLTARNRPWKMNVGWWPQNRLNHNFPYSVVKKGLKCFFKISQAGGFCRFSGKGAPLDWRWVVFRMCSEVLSQHAQTSLQVLDLLKFQKWKCCFLKDEFFLYHQHIQKTGQIVSVSSNAFNLSETLLEFVISWTKIIFR